MKPLHVAMIAGGAVGAFFLYKTWAANQAPQVYGPVAVTNDPNLISQPGQVYPYAAPTPPRVDNQSQPWYNGSQAANPQQTVKGLDTNFVQNVQYVQGTAQIASSVKSIWGDLSDLFGSNTNPTTDVNSTDSSGGFDWNNLAFWN